jgi:very-short-patch-repair endonuclease
MSYRPSEGATPRARALRANATDAERAMWQLLREAFPEARFRFQVPLRMFTADFASHRAKLVIEIDGGQHRPERDAGRTRLIEAEGYRVLRFWNHEVLGNPDGVWAVIAEAWRERHPHPNRPPSRGREQ